MAIQVMKGAMWYPSPPMGASGSAIAFSSFLIDAYNEAAALIFRPPKAGTIDQVEFVTRTVTTGVTVDARLETVDLATGDPTNTLWGANTNAAVAIADTDDNTWKTGTLTAGAVVTQTDLDNNTPMALVIRGPGSGTVPNLNLGAVNALFAGNFPYSDQFVGAGPSWSKTQSTLCCVLRYSDGSYAYIPGVFPLLSRLSPNYGNNSATDEYGIKFKLPFPCRAVGAWAYYIVAAGADYTVKLYDSDGSTVLASCAQDGNVNQGAVQRALCHQFPSAVNLAKDTYYRLTIVPGTTTQVTAEGFSVSAAAIMDAVDGGQDCHQTQRVDAGAWTDTTTQRIMMGLLLQGFDDAVSAGGNSPRAPLVVHGYNLVG